MACEIWIERNGEEVLLEVDYYVDPGEKPTMNCPGYPGGIIIRSVRHLGAEVHLTKAEMETIEAEVEERERDWA